MVQMYDYYKALKPVLVMLELVSALPKRNSSKSYKIKAYVMLFIAGWNTLTNFAYSFINYKDVGSITFSVCMLMAIFHAFLKHFLMYTNSAKFFQLMSYLENPILTDHGRLNAYADKKLRQINITLPLYFFATMGTAFLVTSSSIVGYKNRELATPMPIDVQKLPMAVYAIVWVAQTLGTLFTAWILPAFDGIIIYFMGIASAQIKILRESIMTSTDNIPGGISGPCAEFDEIVNSRLEKCVIHHVTVERYIRSIEDTFVVSFTVQITMSLFIGVFVLFNLAITPVADPHFGKYFLFFVSYFFELTLVFIPGNEIIEQSNKITDACYMTDWIKCGPSVRKTLFIIMERSKRPLRLRAAKFVELSIQSYVGIIKSSFSYFTVLRNVYSETSKAIAGSQK